MKKILFVLLIITSCTHKVDRFDELSLISVSFGDKISLIDSTTASSIKEKLTNSESIVGPIKAYNKYKLTFVSAEADTVIAIVYGDNQYFSFGGNYYKARENIIPVSIMQMIK